MRLFVGFFVVLTTLFTSFTTHAGVMLQGFYWDAESPWDNSWWTQLANQSQELSQAGFTAIWIPPVLKSASGGYSRGYDPYDDYDLGSKDQRGTIPTRWGTRDELQRMVAQSRANGMEVILDLNVTHRAGDSGDKSYHYKNAFGEDGKGRFQKGMMDFGDDFPFGRLLNYSSAYMRDGLKQAGEWLVKSLGTQGFRIDSAKHIPSEFLRDYLSHGELSKQFVVLEYWDNPDIVHNYIKSGLNSRAAAFDFATWATLKDMSAGKGFFDMRRLNKPGLIGSAPDLAVTFAENDDTDRGFPTRENKHLGYAFILTSEGYPSVYWKDYFVYGLKDLINNLMWIHGAFAHGGTENRWADDDLIVYERTGQPGLLVGLNDSTWQTRSENVQTNFGANVELHDYSGNHSPVWTDGSGRAQISVKPNSFAAYSKAEHQYRHQPAHFKTTQEFHGAADLDIQPAQNGKFSKVGSIYVEAGTALDWEITYDRHDWKNESKLVMQILDPNGKVITSNSYGPSVGIAKGYTHVDKTGWYRLEVSAENVPQNVNFWWKQTYQAPR